MNDGPPSRDALRAECQAFCRYLTGVPPTDYVLWCYERAWVSAALPQVTADTLIERSLLGVARRGRLAARAADGYARLFRPYSGLRRRLILLLAILENTPPSAVLLTSADRRGTGARVLGLAGGLLASGACLLLGILILGPVHLLGSLGGSRAR